MNKETGKVIKFRLAPAGSSDAASADFLRELADMCDNCKVDGLAVFYSTGEGDDRLFNFHHLSGNLSEVAYTMDLARHEWLKGALE